MPRKAKEKLEKDELNKKVNGTKKATAKRMPRKKKEPIIEYYDLPTAYHKTLVKILAQTPSILFVYWDVAEEDANNLRKIYGENFFDETIPFLQVSNETKKNQFEVEINDYANSWYIHIPDSDCKYEVTLIRKPKNNTSIANTINNMVSISSSNNLQSPNNHILFEKLGKTVFFKDIKNNTVTKKDISSFAFMHNMGRIYNIYDLYKEIYKNELNGNELDQFLSSSKML